MIRLEQTYSGTFQVQCKTASLVQKALQLLKAALGLSFSRPVLSSFIAYPVPGKKPISSKPATAVEVRRRIIHKKRAEGKCSISTWLTQSVKTELDVFCQERGLNLEEALNQLIPIGINTTCFVLKQLELEPKSSI